jgi:glycosyltransferase involved in cell wall biosynthesis
VKYLVVTKDFYPPFRVDLTVLYGEELVKKGHEIDWLMQSGEHSEVDYETEWAGGRALVGRCDKGATVWRRLRKNLQGLRNDFKMLGLVKKEQYDFIQVRDKFTAALVAIVAAKLNGTKFVFWLSYPFPEASIHKAKDGSARYPFLYFLRGHLYKFLLYKLIIPSASHVFVQSEQMRRDIADEGIAPEKMTAVPMGVDLPKIQQPVSSYKVSKPVGEKWLLYLGTLVKIRKIDFLVRVLEKVHVRHPDAVLVLVGGGQDEGDEKIIRDEASRMAVTDRLKMTGFLPMEHAWAYVDQADICLSPFYPTPILNSTSPTKLCEYMALSKLVVANDHPEQKVVIEESGGGLCVAYDESAFADAICELLELGSAEASTMVMSGRQYVEAHRSYVVIADNVAAEYERICLL